MIGWFHDNVLQKHVFYCCSNDEKNYFLLDLVHYTLEVQFLSRNIKHGLKIFLKS